MGAGNTSAAVELETGRVIIGENVDSDQDSVLLELEKYMNESRNQGKSDLV